MQATEAKGLPLYIIADRLQAAEHEHSREHPELQPSISPWPGAYTPLWPQAVRACMKPQTIRDQPQTQPRVYPHESRQLRHVRTCGSTGSCPGAHTAQLLPALAMSISHTIVISRRISSHGKYLHRLRDVRWWWLVPAQWDSQCMYRSLAADIAGSTTRASALALMFRYNVLGTRRSRCRHGPEGRLSWSQSRQLEVIVANLKVTKQKGGRTEAQAGRRHAEELVVQFQDAYSGWHGTCHLQSASGSVQSRYH